MKSEAYRLWRLGFDDAYTGECPEDAPYNYRWYAEGRIEGNRLRQIHRQQIAHSLTIVRRRRTGKRSFA